MRHNTATALRFARDVHTMRESVRRSYAGFCVISGEHKTDLQERGEAYILDPAHIFAASTYPEISECIENGLPIIRLRHNWPFMQHPFGCLDKEFSIYYPNGRDRRPAERIQWIVDNVHDDFRGRVLSQLITLITEAATFSQKVLSQRDKCLEIIEAVA